MKQLISSVHDHTVHRRRRTKRPEEEIPSSPSHLSSSPGVCLFRPVVMWRHFESNITLYQAEPDLYKTDIKIKPDLDQGHNSY